MMYGNCAERREFAFAESLSYSLGLFPRLHAEERRIVRAFAVHQWNEALIGQFFFAAVGDLDLRGALQGNVPFVRLEIVGRQTLQPCPPPSTPRIAAHQPNLAKANPSGFAPSAYKRRYDHRYLSVVGAVYILFIVEGFDLAWCLCRRAGGIRIHAEVPAPT